MDNLMIDEVSRLYQAIRDFVKDFYPNTSRDGRLDHLIAEVEELEDAIASGKKLDIVDEAADVCIIAFHMMIAEDHDPVQVMMRKLQLARERIESGVKAPRVFRERDEL